MPERMSVLQDTLPACAAPRPPDLLAAGDRLWQALQGPGAAASATWVPRSWKATRRADGRAGDRLAGCRPAGAAAFPDQPEGAGRDGQDLHRLAAELGAGTALASGHDGVARSESDNPLVRLVHCLGTEPMPLAEARCSERLHRLDLRRRDLDLSASRP